jgi:hypothetical protein
MESANVVVYTQRRVRSCLLSLLLVSTSSAFTSPIFQETVTLQRTAPSKTNGVEIELPNFEELFGRIQDVSPLARLAISGTGSGIGGGFGAVDDSSEYNIS